MEVREKIMKTATLIKQKQKALGKIRDEVYELQEKLQRDRIPTMKKRVGKCFFTSNGYGHDRTWNIYGKIVGITDDGQFLFDQFESMSDGRYEFKRRQIEEARLYGWKLIGLTRFEKELALFMRDARGIGIDSFNTALAKEMKKINRRRHR